MLVLPPSPGSSHLDVRAAVALSPQPGLSSTHSPGQLKLYSKVKPGILKASTSKKKDKTRRSPDWNGPHFFRQAWHWDGQALRPGFHRTDVGKGEFS